MYSPSLTEMTPELFTFKDKIGFQDFSPDHATECG